MVIDSQGPGHIDQVYRDTLPNCVFSGHEPAAVAGTPCHPHGAQAGYYAACLLTPENGFNKGDVEVVFARVFDSRAEAIPGVDDWMLDIIARERPDIVNRSWGLAVSGCDWGRMIGEATWGPWVEKFEALRKDIGFVDFGAAGNSGNWTKDNTVNYPQRMLSRSVIVGACRRDGRASVFSSDGPEVDCVAWGEDIYLLSGDHWDVGSGTSFSCPKMAGLCAVMGYDYDQFQALIDSDSFTRPRNATRSNKWGRGNGEDLYQRYFSQLPKRQLTPDAVPALATTYFDFLAINDSKARNTAGHCLPNVKGKDRQHG